MRLLERQDPVEAAHENYQRALAAWQDAQQRRAKLDDAAEARRLERKRRAAAAARREARSYELLPGDEAAEQVATLEREAEEHEAEKERLDREIEEAREALELAREQLREVVTAEVPRLLEELDERAREDREKLGSLGHLVAERAPDVADRMERRREKLRGLHVLLTRLASSSVEDGAAVASAQRRRVEAHVREQVNRATPAERLGHRVVREAARFRDVEDLDAPGDATTYTGLQRKIEP